jgi:hypothetical protein
MGKRSANGEAQADYLLPAMVGKPPASGFPKNLSSQPKE